MHIPSLQIPNAIWASAGAAEGDTELNAFDNALLAAQVGNLNLVRVSSVLPQDATVLEAPPQITPGSLVPTVYSVQVSARPGETVAAAVGIGVAGGSHGMFTIAGASRTRWKRRTQMIDVGLPVAGCAGRRSSSLDREQGRRMAALSRPSPVGGVSK